MLLSRFILTTAASGVIASPLTQRDSSITCPSGNQTPKCCQILVPVNILGQTVDIGVGCVNRTQYPQTSQSRALIQATLTCPVVGSSCKGQTLCCNTENVSREHYVDEVKLILNSF